MEEKKHFFEKVKEHKTEIIATGVTLISLAGVILLTKNWDSVKEFTVAGFLKNGSEAGAIIRPIPKLVENNMPKSLPSKKIIDVSEHIRNLSVGCHASAEKLATAAEHGYSLLPNQTWVIPYTKNCA